SAPALRFWSAPAERSGDGALDFRRALELTQGSGLARAPHPKRRGASLPAALQKLARPSPPCKSNFLSIFLVCSSRLFSFRSELELVPPRLRGGALLFD